MKGSTAHVAVAAEIRLAPSAPNFPAGQPKGATNGFIEGLGVTGLQLGAPEEGETDGDKEGAYEGSTEGMVRHMR